MSDKIPFLDLKRQYLSLKTQIMKGVEDVFARTAFTNGFSVENFEKKFAAYCHVQYAVAVSNGTTALQLALRALDIKQGDEVIVPANTFIATAWAPAYLHAIPVFVDCDADYWQIDAAMVEKKISKKTKAIIGVHLYGHPFDVDRLKDIARANKIFLIEDSAQAHGAAYKGQRVGGLAEMGCFSFYPGKNLGTYGEGGGITTNNRAYAERIARLRNHASVNKYYHEEIGYNMRMGGIEGMVLDVKLDYLDAWNSRRREIASMYLAGIKNAKIRLPKEAPYAKSVYHLFVVTTDKREELMQYLNSKNIFPGIHYPVPCHLQKAFAHLGYREGSLPQAEYLSTHCLSLPMFPELTNEEVAIVIDAINAY